MSAVYSRSFFAEAGATGDNTFSIPAGYTAVIRDIDVYWGSEIEVPEGRVLGAAGQAFMTWQGAALAANISSWRGRHVVAGPADLTVAVDNGNADVSISGYLLATNGP